MTTSRSFKYDLNYVQAGLEILDSYLLSDDIFWPLGIVPPEGEPDYPRFTLDGILLAKTRLAAHPMESDQARQAAEINSATDLQRAKHRVAWEKKAWQCYRVRLRMWGDFIQEYQKNPGDNADRYGYEVRLRAMLTLLEPEIDTHDSAEVKLLDSLDRYVKSVMVPGGFIWDADIQAGFPREKYWFLYGKIP